MQENMKKTILSLVALALSSVAMAQHPKAGTFSIIPRIGVSIANLGNDAIVAGGGSNFENTFSSRYRTGFAGGLDFDYQFMRNLSVSLGAYYVQQGCNYKNDFVGDYDSGMSISTGVGYSNMSTQLQYVQVPLMLNAYIAPGVAIKAGVQLGFALSGKSKITEINYTKDGNGEVVASKPEALVTKLNSTMKGVNFSIPVGFSYEFSNVILDARYNIGLTPFQEIKDYEGPKNKVFMVTAGYRFAL